eukprot:Clim_evm4s86 gene=Clim_evmTU4s86
MERSTAILKELSEAEALVISCLELAAATAKGLSGELDSEDDATRMDEHTLAESMHAFHANLTQIRNTVHTVIEQGNFEARAFEGTAYEEEQRLSLAVEARDIVRDQLTKMIESTDKALEDSGDPS